jgi:hypothetical protein
MLSEATSDTRVSTTNGRQWANAGLRPRWVGRNGPVSQFGGTIAAVSSESGFRRLVKEKYSCFSFMYGNIRCNSRGAIARYAKRVVKL